MTQTVVTPVTPPRTGSRPAWLVIALCWMIVVFDGYDLIVYGTTIPSLLEEPGWNLTPATAGTIGSLAFAGMLVGALAAGNLADRLGRRRTILGAIAWFTLFTGLSGLAPNPETFGVLRFVAGIGLGGLVPSANALTAEFVTPRLRSGVSTIMMSGVPIGGSIAALLAIPVLPTLGWQSMYLFAFSGVLLLLVAVVLLPESPTWLRAHGRVEEAGAVEQQYGVAHATTHSTEHHHPSTTTRASAPCSGRGSRSPPRCSRSPRSPPSSPGTASAPGCPS